MTKSVLFQRLSVCICLAFMPQASHAAINPQIWDLGMRSPNATYPTDIVAKNISCKGKQKFLIEVHDAPWLRVTGKKVLRGLRPGERKATQAIIDLHGMAPGPYQGKLVVTCTSCPPPPKCIQNTSQIDVFVTVAGDSVAKYVSGDESDEVLRGKTGRVFMDSFSELEQRFSITLDPKRAAVAADATGVLAAHVPVNNYNTTPEIRPREKVFSAIAVANPYRGTSVHLVSVLADEDLKFRSFRFSSQQGDLVQELPAPKGTMGGVRIREVEKDSKPRPRPFFPLSISNLEIRSCIYFTVDVSVFFMSWDIADCYDCGEVLHCREPGNGTWLF